MAHVSGGRGAGGLWLSSAARRGSLLFCLMSQLGEKALSVGALLLSHMLGIRMQYRFSLNIQRLTVLQVFAFLGFRCQIAQSEILETLLLNFVGGHAFAVWLLTCCARRIGDDEVDL